MFDETKIFITVGWVHFFLLFRCHPFNHPFSIIPLPAVNVTGSGAFAKEFSPKFVSRPVWNISILEFLYPNILHLHLVCKGLNGAVLVLQDNIQTISYVLWPPPPPKKKKKTAPENALFGEVHIPVTWQRDLTTAEPRTDHSSAGVILGLQDVVPECHWSLFCPSHIRLPTRLQPTGDQLNLCDPPWHLVRKCHFPLCSPFPCCEVDMKSPLHYTDIFLGASLVQISSQGFRSGREYTHLSFYFQI